MKLAVREAKRRRKEESERHKEQQHALAQSRTFLLGSVGQQHRACAESFRERTPEISIKMVAEEGSNPCNGNLDRGMPVCLKSFDGLGTPRHTQKWRREKRRRFSD